MASASFPIGFWTDERSEAPRLRSRDSGFVPEGLVRWIAYPPFDSMHWAQTNPSPPAACTPWPTDLSDLRLSYEAVISTPNKRTGVPRLMLYAKATWVAGWMIRTPHDTHARQRPAAIGVPWRTTSRSACRDVRLRNMHRG